MSDAQIYGGEDEESIDYEEEALEELTLSVAKGIRKKEAITSFLTPA